MRPVRKNDEPLERFEGKDGVEKILIRVRCYAGDVIKEQAIQFTNTETLLVSDISEAVASKQGLAKEFGQFFGLWIVGKELNLQLRPKQDIFEVVTKWHKWNEKYTHNPKCDDPEDPVNEFYFIFKREALLSLPVEKKITDEAVLKLLYGEAHQRVLAGTYPIKVKDAASLAAIQSQILYGNYVKEKHPPGFIASAFKEYVPSYILKETTVEDLESKVFQQWQVYTGRSQVICRHLYLQYLRQYPFYGSTFFPACRSLPPNGFFEQRREHLLVGINSGGVQIVDLDKKRVVFNQYWDNVKFVHTADTLVFELKQPIIPNSKTKGPIHEVSIISPQSHLINNVLVKGVLTYEQELEGIEHIRRQQAMQNQKDGSLAVEQQSRGEKQRRFSRMSQCQAMDTSSAPPSPQLGPSGPSQSYLETRRKSVQLQQAANAPALSSSGGAPATRERRQSVNGSVRRYTLQSTAPQTVNQDALFSPISEDNYNSNQDLSDFNSYNKRQSAAPPQARILETKIPPSYNSAPPYSRRNSALPQDIDSKVGNVNNSAR